MLSQRMVVLAPKILKRNFGIVAPALQAAAVDPIQQLFVDKIRDYKSQSTGGKLNLPPEIQAEKKKELEKLATQYGGEGSEMTSFPKFSFSEPKVEVNPLESTSK